MSEIYHCAQCCLTFDSGYSHYLSGPDGDYGGEAFRVCSRCGTQYRLQHARLAKSDRLSSQPSPITISPRGEAYAECVGRSREKLSFLLDDDNPSNWAPNAILEVIVPELLLEHFGAWKTVAERYVPSDGPVVFGRRMDATLEIEKIECSYCHSVGAIIEWETQQEICPRCNARGIVLVAAYIT